MTFNHFTLLATFRFFILVHFIVPNHTRFSKIGHPYTCYNYIKFVQNLPYYKNLDGNHRKILESSLNFRRG